MSNLYDPYKEDHLPKTAQNGVLTNGSSLLARALSTLWTWEEGNPAEPAEHFAEVSGMSGLWGC